MFLKKTRIFIFEEYEILQIVNLYFIITKLKNRIIQYKVQNNLKQNSNYYSIITYFDF